MNLAELACPLCRGVLVERGEALACDACRVEYINRQGVPNFIVEQMYESRERYDDAMRIIDFWGNGWKQRLADEQHAPMFRAKGAELAQVARNLLEQHRKNQSFMTQLVSAEGHPSRLVLNIGCGSGSEALVIASSGARCLAVDITAEAAAAAATLIGNLGGQGGGARADARFLPVTSDSIDAVYSSGVLHHSPDIVKSIGEVHRVLKPGGKAYIMLYAKYSILFMQTRIGGFLRGQFSRQRQLRAMSAGTEGDWRTGNRTNPHTVTFTRREVQDLFAGFRKVSVEKRVFSFRQIKGVGRVLEAMRLVKPLDRGLRFLNPVFGACLFIVAVK